MRLEKSKDWNLAGTKKRMKRPLRVLIVSEHTLWRAALRSLLESSDSAIIVIGEFAPGSDAVRQITNLGPDIVILDFVPYKLDGFELLRRIRPIENVRKLIVTAQIRKQDLARVLQLGVKGIVLKRSPVEDLIQCVRWTAADRTCIQQNDGWWVRTASAFKVSTSGSRQARFRITRREMEIIEAVAAGHTNKEIASQLRLSVDTVRHHVTNIFNKTGASNRLELVLFAIKKKLVDTTQLGIASTAVAALRRERSA